MSGIVARNPGLIGATLNNKDSYIGIITDMLHVHKANVEIAVKLKNDHAYIVTDALAPACTTMTKFHWAGKNLYVIDGKCVDDNGILGGAVHTMNIGIKNCV
jgi:N-acetylglucosamine-6-phosphate deacetylase